MLRWPLLLRGVFRRIPIGAGSICSSEVPWADTAREEGTGTAPLVSRMAAEIEEGVPVRGAERFMTTCRVLCMDGSLVEKAHFNFHEARVALGQRPGDNA